MAAETPSTKPARQPFKRLFGIFVTGVLAALPLAATIAIVIWAGRLAAQYLGPYSMIGWTLRSIGLGVGGSEVFAYSVGAAIVLLAIFLLGILVQTRLNTVVSMVTDGIVRRIPLVRGVYDTVSKLVGLFASREDATTRSMRPVWLHFGGVGGTTVLGLLSTPEPIRIGERNYSAVLIPTSPVPVGGGLVFVPEDWVTPAEMGVEGLTSIYVSMGITSAQHAGVGADKSESGPAPETDQARESDQTRRTESGQGPVPEQQPAAPECQPVARARAGVSDDAGARGGVAF